MRPAKVRKAIEDIYIARAGILIQISIVTTDTISKSEIVNAQAMYSNTIGNEM